MSGTEFDPEYGQVMLLEKALYRLKISGAELRAHLAETVYAMGDNPRYADPDV